MHGKNVEFGHCIFFPSLSRLHAFLLLIIWWSHPSEVIILASKHEPSPLPDNFSIHDSVVLPRIRCSYGGLFGTKLTHHQKQENLASFLKEEREMIFSIYPAPKITMWQVQLFWVGGLQLSMLFDILETQ